MLRNIINLGFCLIIAACVKHINPVERDFNLYHGTGFDKNMRPIEARMGRPDASLIKPVQRMSPPPLPPNFIPNRWRIPNSGNVLQLQPSRNKVVAPKAVESQQVKVEEVVSGSEHYPNPYYTPIEVKKMQDIDYESPIGPPSPFNKDSGGQDFQSLTN